MNDDTNALVERARELAGYKYQHHTIHVPAALNLLADTVERLERDRDALAAEVTKFRALGSYTSQPDPPAPPQLNGTELRERLEAAFRLSTRTTLSGLDQMELFACIQQSADTIERLERELAEINAVAAILAEQCEKLQKALRELGVVSPRKRRKQNERQSKI